VDTVQSSVFHPREASEDHHPHACTDGLVFLTYTVFEETVGEEIERLEVVPCRRCVNNSRSSHPEGLKQGPEHPSGRPGPSPLGDA